jgi:hypothetical protein
VNSPAGSSPAKTEKSKPREESWRRRAIRYNRRVLRTLVFFSLITSAHANLDNLVNASQSFAAAIDEQITTDQSDPSPTDFAEKTVAYADAKISYFQALRAAMPELTNIAMGREPRPPQVDKFRDAFQPAGEIRETAAERETAALLKRFSGDPEVQKAAAEFDHAQKLEETFLKDFEGQDFTSRRLLEEFESRSFGRWRSAAAPGSGS